MDSILDNLVEAEDARLSGTASAPADGPAGTDGPEGAEANGDDDMHADVDFWSISLPTVGGVKGGDEDGHVAAEHANELLRRRIEERERRAEAGLPPVTPDSQDGSDPADGVATEVRIGLTTIAVPGKSSKDPRSRRGGKRRGSTASGSDGSRMSQASRVSKSTIVGEVNRQVRAKLRDEAKSSKNRGAAKSAAAFELRQRVKELKLKIAEDTAEVEQLTAEINRVAKEIPKYKRELGGVLALRENEASIRRQTDILERRIVKSQNEYMKEVDKNNELRRQVNIARREKLALVAENAAYRKDFNDTAADSQRREESIKSNEKDIAKAKRDISRLKQAFAEQEDTLRTEWEARDAGDAKLDLPDDEGDDDLDALVKSGRMTYQREEALQGKVALNRWTTGVSYNLALSAEERAQMLLDIFAVVSEATGIETPEAFVDVFQTAEAANYALYRRVDALIAESKELQGGIDKVQRKRRSLRAKMRVGNEERSGVLSQVATRARTKREQAGAQETAHEQLVASSAAIKHGMARIMDRLDIHDETYGSLSEHNMTKYFGIIEERVREAMIRYVNFMHARPSTRGSRPSSRARGASTGGDRRESNMGSRGRLDGPAPGSRGAGAILSLMGLDETALESGSSAHARAQAASVGRRSHTAAASGEYQASPLPPQVIAAQTLSVGPNTASGGLRTSIRGVSVPTTEGPKAGDATMNDAFIRPWDALMATSTSSPSTPAMGDTMYTDDWAATTGGSTGAGGATESDTAPPEALLAALLDDSKPLSVPPPKLRNRLSTLVPRSPASPTEGISGGNADGLGNSASAPLLALASSDATLDAGADGSMASKASAPGASGSDSHAEASSGTPQTDDALVAEIPKPRSPKPASGARGTATRGNSRSTAPAKKGQKGQKGQKRRKAGPGAATAASSLPTSSLGPGPAGGTPQVPAVVR